MEVYKSAKKRCVLSRISTEYQERVGVLYMDEHGVPRTGFTWMSTEYQERALHG